jgi:hypothetical protein
MAESLDAAVVERLTRAVRAAQDLSDVLWESLHEELSERSTGPRMGRVAELSERLVDVASTVMALTTDATEGFLARESAVTPASPVAPEPAVAPEPPVAPDSPFAPESPAAPEPPSGAVIVDEREDFVGASHAPGRSPLGPLAPPLPEAPRISPEPQPRALPWDTPLSDDDELRVSRAADRRLVSPSIEPLDKPA